jgi:hypothetical protein
MHDGAVLSAAKKWQYASLRFDGTPVRYRS